MAEITVKTSRKGDDRPTDKTKAAVGGRPAQAAGAEAQWIVTRYASCWNCFAINEINSENGIFYCWNCGAYCEF